MAKTYLESIAHFEESVREYLIAYVPEQPLLIIGVLHGRRNPKIMAAILRDRK